MLSAISLTPCATGAQRMADKASTDTPDAPAGAVNNSSAADDDKGVAVFVEIVDKIVAR
jgi:hypothetical protein